MRKLLHNLPVSVCVWFSLCKLYIRETFWRYLMLMKNVMSFPVTPTFNETVAQISSLYRKQVAQSMQYRFY
jgi:hypothetical protein